VELISSWVTSPYAWVVAFFLFMLVELGTGAVFSMICGLGSLVTAIALWSGLVEGPGYAVLTFLVSTITLTVVLWRPLQRMMQGLKSDPTDPAIDPFVGDMATVVDGPLTPQGGQIRVHGSKMSAVLSSDAGVDSLEPGTQVLVNRMDRQQRFVVAPIQAETATDDDTTETT